MDLVEATSCAVFSVVVGFWFCFQPALQISTGIQTIHETYYKLTVKILVRCGFRDSLSMTVYSLKTYQLCSVNSQLSATFQTPLYLCSWLQ